ncbi:hypothetical protein CTAM01_17027 [Colletotrichum tamarilloi]|uniref:Uncharacterized protein n=1 Tax=Colletotrichum tamarilloi TaxID=1209934 RepID=A0ABQ9QGV0_9PEZI|nr:uncharacterized protein CTAM01_17027 [Colletotrichum tamarilloi]KAK1466171.1 hypothetical protein CTAM01_17027 [Colletotrichum tamarilloi]
MATHERQRSERGVVLYAPERAVGLPNAQFPQGIPEMKTFVVALVARNKWRKMVTADGMRPNCDGVTYLTMPKLVGQGHSMCMIASNVLCLITSPRNISITNQILVHFASSISAYYNSKKMVAIKNLLIATLTSSVIARPLLSGRNVPDIEVDSVASIETRAEAAKNVNAAATYGNGGSFGNGGAYKNGNNGGGFNSGGGFSSGNGGGNCDYSEKNRLDQEIRNRERMKDRLDDEIQRRQNMKDQLDQEIRRKQNGGW